MILSIFIHTATNLLWISDYLAQKNSFVTFIDRIKDQMDIVFSQPAEWDTERNYTPDSVEVCVYNDHNSVMFWTLHKKQDIYNIFQKHFISN